MAALSAAKGVSQVMNRCEDAKMSGCLDLSECELLYLADALYLVLRDYTINACNLKNNKLKKFPVKLVKNFSKLTVLNLEGNMLQELPENMGEFSNLRGINLSRNQFKTLPESILKCEKLALLDISSNLIEEIDIEEVFKHLPSLKQLKLNGNPFVDKNRGKWIELQKQLSKICKIIIS